jgi:PAS domain S-box-containing protein
MNMPLSPKDLKRLLRLDEYQVLGTEKEDRFDDLALLASAICGTKSSGIGFITEDSVWFKSRFGDFPETLPRAESPCERFVEEPRPIVIPNLLADPRYANFSWVSGGAEVRAYAGVPLVNLDGDVLGSLCVMDREPREFHPDQIKSLQALARQIVSQLDLQRERRRLELSHEQITLERKRKDEILQRERNLLTLIGEHVGDVIWISDTDHQSLLFMSRAYETIFERSLDSILKRPANLLDSVHPEDKERVRLRFVHGINSSFEETFRILTPAGNLKWLSSHTFPVLDSSGHVTSLVGIVRDITLTIQEQDKGRAERANLQAVLDNLPLSISTFDENGNRDWVNQEWVRCLGWEAKEAVGKGILRDMFIEEAEFEKAQMMAISTEWREVTLLTKSCQVKNMASLMMALPSGKKLSVARDLTFERAQARTIEDQQQKMAESARFTALGEMAAGIAHEINNPLAIIQSSAELINLSLGRAEPDMNKVRSAVGHIEGTVVRIAKIISGLKSFARDGGKDPFAPASFRTIISETLELCQMRFRNSGVQLEILMPDGDLPLDCRSVQISQVLLNLLNNAFDAINGQTKKQVAVRLLADDAYYRLQVCDNGPGVPRAIREKIMQPFFTTKPPGKGTGIGLSLSRSIIEDHGGKLLLKDLSGTTCFEVLMPKAQVSKKAA